MVVGMSPHVEGGPVGEDVHVGRHVNSLFVQVVKHRFWYLVGVTQVGGPDLFVVGGARL